MKGYKVTNADYTCRDQKFETGQTYKIEGKLILCGNGFHFCELPASCFEYYSFTPTNHVFEVEAIGEVITDGNKSCTSEIVIGRELSWEEVLKIVNTGLHNSGHSNSGDSNSGNWNSGYRNSGYRNSGNWNSGNSNSGDRNSGDRNSGNWNSGDSNSGYRNSGNSNSSNWNSGNRNSGYWNSGNWNSGNSNSGDRNSGYRNSGNWNSGDRNSGDSNSGYRNSGAFCLDRDPKMWLFDQPTTMTVREWEESEACKLLYSHLETTIWVESDYMTTEEKGKYPSHETTGGYLKDKSLKEAWRDMWPQLDDSKRSLFTSLPNFDAEKFEIITGIKV